MNQNDPVTQVERAVVRWLEEEGSAKSTLAGAIVVLDKLAEKAPIAFSDVFTAGGQLIGGRGKGLSNTLAKYGINHPFLSDGVTTRSTEKFRRLIERIDFGQPLAPLSVEQRQSAVKKLIRPVLLQIEAFLLRQHLSVTCDRQASPVAWIADILTIARDRSAGRVEQHLIGAKFECRFDEEKVNRLPAFAADAQTERLGDFVIGRTVYHVTANPTAALIQKCADNLKRGFHPIILAPRDVVERAKGMAAYDNLVRNLTIFAIEDFLAQNLIEMADAASQQYFDALVRMVEAYNHRIEDAETDSSLRIELR